jgi:hypothetical protein
MERGKRREKGTKRIWNQTHRERNKNYKQGKIRALPTEKHDNQTAKEDMETTQPDAETDAAKSSNSPKRNKKQKTDREKTETKDRTRSRTRQTSPSRI